MISLPWNGDIAIIGLSCRFPGAATAEEYWKNLCDGVESVTFFADEELLAAGVDPTLVANPSYVRAAPILRDVEMFDAAFFGYSPKDATMMDPQQRLFLELVFFPPPAGLSRAICWPNCTMQIFPARLRALRTSIMTRTSSARGFPSS